MKYLLGGMDFIDALDGRGSLSLVNEVQHFLSEVKEGKREKLIFLIKAGLLERFGAYVIDGIIIIFLPFFLYWILRFYIPSIPSIDNPDTFVFFIFFMWLTIISYFIITEASQWRGTFGKKVCNLIVTTPTNERASLFQIVLRNVIKCCTVFFPFTLVIVLIPAFVTENKQTLYDVLSRTVVQKNPVSWKRYKNIDKETMSV